MAEQQGLQPMALPGRQLHWLLAAALLGDVQPQPSTAQAELCHGVEALDQHYKPLSRLIKRCVFFWWVLCCVWSCVPCLCVCGVGDRAGGALDAADGADLDVADDQAAGVHDAVDDVVDDVKEADIIHSVMNTSSLIISNIKISTISSIKSTTRMVVNRQQNVAQQSRLESSQAQEAHEAKKPLKPKSHRSQKGQRATDATRRLEKPSSRQEKNEKPDPNSFNRKRPENIPPSLNLIIPY